MVVTKKIVLRFPKRLVDRPIVGRLIKDYNLDFNILKASITSEEGLLVLELIGEQQDYDNGIRYLTKTGVQIQALSQDVIRNEERCTHCGACVTLCPTNAFEVEAETKRIIFYSEKCIACAICIKGCPPRAMELHF
jgi:ferredoxin